MFARMITVGSDGDGYGYVSDIRAEDQFECWIKNHYVQLTLYAPVLIYLTLSFILLCLSMRRIQHITHKKKRKV